YDTRRTVPPRRLCTLPFSTRPADRVRRSMKAAGQDSSRDRLLRAGKTLFAERGYEATTTAAIAKSAGTSHSQLVKHFKDKQGVIGAILERAWQQLNSAVQLAIDRINNPLERLTLAVNMFLTTIEKDERLRA